MFEPWIGANYGAPDNLFGGQKLLIVGETLPGEDLGRDAAKSAIEAHLAGRRSRHLSGVTEALIGRLERQISPEEEQEAWASIAYCTYVPEGIGDAMRPTARQLAAGRLPLRRALGDLQPDVAMVLGLDTWLDAAAGLGLNGDPLKEEHVSFGNVLVGRMQRPSRIFAHLVWNDFIRTSLKRALPPEVLPPNVWAQEMASS